MPRQHAQVCTRCAPSADTWAHRCQGCVHRPCPGLHRYSPRAKRRSGHVPHLQMKSFPSRESHWEDKQLLRVGCTASGGWPTENKLSGSFGGPLVSCHVRDRVWGFLLIFFFLISSLLPSPPSLSFFPTTDLPSLLSFLQVPYVYTMASSSVVLWDS